MALLLCKFVQAINSISLGVAIWQQEWLESWMTRCLSLGTQMRVELQWSLKLHVIVTSLWSCSLSPSTLFFLPTSVSSILSFGDVVTRCDCWRQSQRAIVKNGRLEIAPVRSFIREQTCHHWSAKKTLIWEMKYAKLEWKCGGGLELMAFNVGEVDRQWSKRGINTSS